MALNFIANQIAGGGGTITADPVSGAITLTPASGQALNLGGALNFAASPTFTGANGSGSGVSGKGFTFVSGNAGTGNANGGDLVFTAGTLAGSGRAGAFLPTSYVLATAPAGWADGGVSGSVQGWANFVTNITGSQTVQGKTLSSQLNYSGLSQNYAGVTAAFDGVTTSDTSAFNYTGKLRGVMGHVIVQSVGATITKTEAIAGVTIIQAGATGTIGDAYCTSGELIYSATGAFTISNIQGVKGTLNVSAAGSIDQGWAVWGSASTDVGSTGTFTTAAVGVYGLMQHNSAQAVNRATGGQLFVDLTGTGSVTTNAYGVNAYVQSASSSSVAGTVAGVNAAANWGSSATIASIYGLQTQYTITGGATVTNAEGLHILAPSVSSGTLSKGRGVRISDMSNANTGTAEGLRIDNQSRAGSISIVTGGGLHQFTTTANIGSAWTLSDGTTTLYNVDTRNTNGGLAGTHQFLPVAGTIASAAGTTFTNIAARPYTLTLTGGTGVNSLSGMQMLISQPTVTSVSSTTIQGLSTVSIAGPPIMSGSVNSPVGGNTSLWVSSAVATVAGGATEAGIMFGVAASRPTLGQFWGSGVPIISAPQGSVYWRTDGSSTTTRAYINTNGSTGWTALTTVA